MAKMMVMYAKEVLGKTADVSVECSFSDVANQSAELQSFINEACQMGLMGVNNDGTPASTFNPNGVVTRAQFGTVLSRAIWGDENNGGEPYYANHLAALKDSEIMNNISNPSAPEIRGYVMLMMKRADESGAAGESTVCDLPENIVSCQLGDSSCPAECVDKKETEVKAGTLSVSSIGVDYTSVPKAGLVGFGSIKLASAGSDITVDSIKVKNIGLATLDAATRIFFEKN
jgi:hypothetical protein